ncbi:MAG: hypothetical protein ACRDGQ_05020 [Candidatus Limnocylindrales bacterium]
MRCGLIVIGAVVAAVAVIGCTVGAPPGSAGLPLGTPAPAHAETRQGQFRLTFDLPQTDWRTTDAISGRAVLSLESSGGASGAGPGEGSGEFDVGGSGEGLIGFEFEEVGGRHRLVEPATTADCHGYQLAVDRPIASEITKSGGYSATDPNAAFYASFLADPEVHLPAGDWKITAIASFVEGEHCDGASRRLAATILVDVTG